METAEEGGTLPRSDSGRTRLDTKSCVIGEGRLFLTINVHHCLSLSLCVCSKAHKLVMRDYHTQNLLERFSPHTRKSKASVDRDFVKLTQWHS